MATARCISTHPVTLADGRNLAPGDALDDVDPEANADLVEAHQVAFDPEPVDEAPPALAPTTTMTGRSPGAAAASGPSDPPAS